MADRWTQTSLPGALRTSLAVNADSRGSFTELWRASATPLADGAFVQANLSRSRPGVLRGMHFHRRQADLWIVVEGEAFVALVDLRRSDPSQPVAPDAADDGGPPHVLTLQMGVGDALLIPRLVAHGFYALTDLALVYLVSNEFDGSDELGFAWDDRVAAIPWPASDPTLSERDRSNPSLAQARAAL
jgi:dTDP-4-dehydrorhamnose 3,5-epimerase